MNAPRRILIVEDHKDSADMMARALRLHGHHVEVAQTAADAIVLCRRPGAGFDLILCDVGLPDMDGDELIGVLKHECPGAKTVAVTGYGRKEDVDRALASGFDAHLLKPISIEQLAEHIR